MSVRWIQIRRTLSSLKSRAIEGMGYLDKWGHLVVPRLSRLSTPDFLCIGAQKAGTSWLASNCNAHPEIYLPSEEHWYPGTNNEIHYFDWQFHKPLRSYAKKYAAAEGLIKGDITPGYSTLPRDRIQLIARLMPRLRIVMILRNPIHRAWSQALMNLVRGTGRRYEDVSDEEFLEHFDSERSVRRGDYLRIIEDWTSALGREQVFIGFFDDVVNRPINLLEGIFHHVGASNPVEWDRFPYDIAINRGVQIPLPEHHKRYLEGRYRDEIDQLHRLLGHPVDNWRVGSVRT